MDSSEGIRHAQPLAVLRDGPRDGQELPWPAEQVTLHGEGGQYELDGVDSFTGKLVAIWRPDQQLPAPGEATAAGVHVETPADAVPPEAEPSP
ncbi:MAG TPA: hypothetical protein VGH10_00075 [Actinomycetota bacterium]|jgi:hypothetical protein